MNGMPVGVVVAFALLLGYPIFMRFIAQAVQSYRLEMADIGRYLLQSPHVNERTKDNVDVLLDAAYSCKVMILYCVRMPIVLFRSLRSRGGRISSHGITNKEALYKYRRFLILHLISGFAANPLIGIIVAFEFFLLIVALIVAGRVRQLMRCIFVVSENVTHDGKLKHSHS